jgi:hypothetical protein
MFRPLAITYAATSSPALTDSNFVVGGSELSDDPGRERNENPWILMVGGGAPVLI